MLNRFIVQGNVAADAEVKEFSGNAVCSFRIGVFSGKDKPTSWFKVSHWGKYAAENPPQKGEKVIVEGSVAIREYDKADGSKGVSVEINADRVHKLTYKAPEHVDF